MAYDTRSYPIILFGEALSHPGFIRDGGVSTPPDLVGEGYVPNRMGIRFRSHGRPSFTVRAHGGACSPQNAVSASHIVAYRQTAWSRAAARFIADRRLATALRQVIMAHDLAPRARSQPAGTTGTPRPYSPMACFVEPPSCIGSSSFEEILNTGLLSADASAAEASRSSGARRVVFRPSGAHLRSVDAPSAVVSWTSTLHNVVTKTGFTAHGSSTGAFQPSVSPDRCAPPVAVPHRFIA